MRLETPRYLGPLPHLATGIRLPDVFLEGILEALKLRRSAGGLMLSYGRETAPSWVIDAPPGRYEITMGHTGTSITEYLTKGAEAARAKGVVVEMEADHLTVTSSSARAVKRISGYKEKYRLSDEEVEKALSYIKREVDEAASTGYINFYTIDTCELIDPAHEKLEGKRLEDVFYEVYGKVEGEAILDKYANRCFVFIGATGRYFSIYLSRQRVMQLALKYKRSIETTLKIVGYLSEKTPSEYGVEIAFDETPYITREDELFFYLSRLRDYGLRPDFIAPNVGFEKKQDYRGDLAVLERRVERLSAIARSFGTLLCFHSGSGSSPWSGKGPGTYAALLRATGGLLKYKVSGVYFELLMEIYASQPPGSRARKLYEKIYDEVYSYVRREVEEDGPLNSPALRRQLEDYEKKIRPHDPYDPRAELFRYYSFLALNLRDKAGKRYLREEIIETYEGNKELRKKVNEEVKRLTLRLIDGLDFANNLALLADSSLKPSS